MECDIKPTDVYGACKIFALVGRLFTKDTHPTMAKIFKAMGTQAKRDYLYMLNSKENPHQWGEDPEKFRALLAA